MWLGTGLNVNLGIIVSRVLLGVLHGCSGRLLRDARLEIPWFGPVVGDEGDLARLLPLTLTWGGFLT